MWVNASHIAASRVILRLTELDTKCFGLSIAFAYRTAESDLLELQYVCRHRRRTSAHKTDLTTLNIPYLIENDSVPKTMCVLPVFLLIVHFRLDRHIYYN